MKWPRLWDAVLLVVGMSVFLAPFAVGWWNARRAPVPQPAVAFPGTQVVAMQAGVHEGLTWLYAWGPSLGLRRSIDSGHTWSNPLPLPVDAPLVSRVTLAVHPRDARFALLIVPTANGRALYRLDEHERWRRVRTFAASMDVPLLVAPAEEGLYVAWGTTLWHWMPDGRWQVLRKWEKTPARGLASFAGHREIVLLAADGLWRSIDHGERWQKVASKAHAVLASSLPSGKAYALVDDEVWTSSDWGLTWQSLDMPAPARALAMTSAYHDLVYAMDARGRLWRYGPGTLEWRQLSGEAPAARGMVADPSRPGTVYLYGDDGLQIFSETLPTPTPVPTATPTVTPTFTPLVLTPARSATSTPTPSSPPTPTPTPTLTPSPTHPPLSPSPTTGKPPLVPTSTPTPTATATPSPTPVPPSSPSPAPPPSPTPTSLPVQSPTATPTPSPAPTLTPTPGPTPTPTRTPGPPPER